MSVVPIDFINSNKSAIGYSKPILIEKVTGSKKYSYNFVVPVIGRLIFRFDNSHAWLWNKNISFTISKNIEPKNNSPTHVLSKIKDIALKGYFGSKDFQIQKIDNNNYKLKNIKKSNSIYIDVEEKDNIEFSFSVDDDYDINFSLEFLIDLYSQLNKTSFISTFPEQLEIKKLKERNYELEIQSGRQIETIKAKTTEFENLLLSSKDELNETIAKCTSNYFQVTKLEEQLNKFKVEKTDLQKTNKLVIEQLKTKYNKEKEQLKYDLNSIINTNQLKHEKEIEQLKTKKSLLPSDERLGIICRNNQTNSGFVEILEFSKEELKVKYLQGCDVPFRIKRKDVITLVELGDYIKKINNQFLTEIEPNLSIEESYENNLLFYHIITGDIYIMKNKEDENWGSNYNYVKVKLLKSKYQITNKSGEIGKNMIELITPEMYWKLKYEIYKKNQDKLMEQIIRNSENLNKTLEYTKKNYNDLVRDHNNIAF